MGALQHKLNMTYHGRTTLGCISYFELWEIITPLYSAMSLVALWNMEMPWCWMYVMALQQPLVNHKFQDTPGFTE